MLEYFIIIKFMSWQECCIKIFHKIIYVIYKKKLIAGVENKNVLIYISGAFVKCAHLIAIITNFNF